MFALQAQTCADCGKAFSTSQPAALCATCASLRAGPVGPATVQCPICGIEHQIPILSPSKLCGPCRVDPELCRANIAADVARAEAAWAEAAERLNTAVDVASEANVRRFNVAVAAKETGRMGGKHYTPAQMAQSWARALAAGDGLSVLLAAHEALQAAAAELTRVQTWAKQATEAVGPPAPAAPREGR
jgi:hypothetical protein